MATKVVWRGDREVSRNMALYGEKVMDAAFAVGEYYAPQIEAEAKNSAPWQDRTGRARSGLTSQAFREDKRVIIYLWHKMEYGVFLEVRHSSRFSVVLPTLERFYSPIMRTLREALK
ncbi:MAG: hypothetical protein LC130_23255 [Bryobacterales bacterium]|nr:hypothetical protein [Bryobacterales bacterium]